MRTPDNVVIFGVGALGTLFGSHLNKVARVTLVDSWREQVKTLQKRGLTVTEMDGRPSHHQLSVTDQISELSDVDLVLILVKSHQTLDVAPKAVQVLGDNGIVVTLQNGLGNYEQIAQLAGRERTSLGVTFQGATLESCGLLRHAGVGSTTLVRLPGQETLFQGIEDLFHRAGIPVMLVDNADSLVWSKLAVNAAINPLTALLEVPNGSLVEQETWLNLMLAAVQEVTAVAAAKHIDLSGDDMAQKVVEVCRATAKNHSSMFQDIKKNRQTEIEAICGQVVRYSKELGIPTPVNGKLLELVRAKETGQHVNLDF
ncbi:MAG: 2-dehydropantoate 2-reductase [SAR324 cluster bacterium]|nr:2-dehydropantoate 2-reductase [SAR324 cluster bacterium]